MTLLPSVCRASSHQMDRGLLLPCPKRFGPGAPIADRAEAMVPLSEVAIDDGMRREKVLRLVTRLEPLHLPLPPSRWSVRILCPVVQIPAGPVFDVGQQSTSGDTVATQTIGDQPLGLVSQARQQAPEEALGGGAIALLLHQNVQRDAVLVHRTPEIVQHTSDADEHLVKVPRIARPWAAPAQPFGKLDAELPAPVSDAFVGDHHAALGQDQLDVTQAKAEQVIQPHGMADDLGWEAMAMVGPGLWRHPASFARLATRHQPRLLAMPGRADDTRVWTLDAGVVRPAGRRDAAVRRCPACGAGNAAASRTCDNCGTEFLADEPDFDPAPGRLVELTRERIQFLATQPHYRLRDMTLSEAEVRAVARERGYKPGWCRHYLREQAERSAQ